MSKRYISNVPKNEPKKTKITHESSTLTTDRPIIKNVSTSYQHSIPEIEELKRLSSSGQNSVKDWRLWGPYLSERQWGTVREDYSSDANCWDHFSHEDAVFRTYQWGDDGLFGWSDNQARLCMGLALWNGRDKILKERLFGLTGTQGNHGEDVKECYYYLDSTPTHSYTRALYKYLIQAFPYDAILKENKGRGVEDDEYELMDTGVFDNGNYWDVYAEYAKETPTSMLIQYTVENKSDVASEIHILPQVWFRNTWSWRTEQTTKPEIYLKQSATIACVHPDFDEPYLFVVDKGPDNKMPQMLFTENDTNQTKLTGAVNKDRYMYSKDAFHEYIVNGKESAVNMVQRGTKFAAYYKMIVPGHGSAIIRCRLLQDQQQTPPSFDKNFVGVFNARKAQCEQFYKQVIPRQLTAEEKNVMRQAFAGLCFTKQFFYYHVREWAQGRVKPLNSDWKHMLNHDVISMPDKWEFPWYATWDLAFHMVPFALIDPEFAKSQLLLFLSERYMHPNGQLPAYEFNFSDVNPPVHAWACLQVYNTTLNDNPKDTDFLKRCFHKLMLNFNWWVNRKDRHGCHIYHGGFLGMDNISCVNRSDLPHNTTLDQVDGTAWMAFYCICMLKIALELALTDLVYEDMAIKFLEHFFFINDAINGEEYGLWDAVDGFYYDRLTDDKNDVHVLRIRSLVGLSSMFAAYTLDIDSLRKLPTLHSKLNELFDNRKELATRFDKVNNGEQILLSIPNKCQLQAMLRYLVNTEEFLSPYGIRALSKYHKDHPVSIQIDGTVHSVTYSPGESNSGMFGGNSNWRGPIWICMNYLLLESLDVYGKFYGNDLTIEMTPGCDKSLLDLASNIRTRLTSVFLPDNTGARPMHGSDSIYTSNSSWNDLVLFYEYFHADSGRGCGASHQTGWTALIANIMKRIAESRH